MTDKRYALHLAVVQPSSYVGASQAGVLPDWGGRYECRWNDDFSAFRTVRLRWWDDASYAAYQAGDDEDELLEEAYPVVGETPPLPPPADDGLPF